MQVKFFTPASNATDDTSEQREKLNSQLGLTGQMQLVENGGYYTASPIECAVYKMLLSEQTKLTNYDCKPLPIEILHWLAEHNSEFAKLELWHDTNGRYAPLLVGYLTDTWKAPALLLATWGERFDIFPAMLSAAASRQRAAFKLKLVRIAQQVKQSEAAYNEMADDDIITASTPSFYGAE